MPSLGAYAFKTIIGSTVVVRIVLQKFGEISKGEVREILEVLEECYDRLQPHEVEILDLLLFEETSAMRSFYSAERAAMGVVSTEFGERFYAHHDAWRGTPRIGVCVGRIRELPKNLKLGILRHEVAHSVLHGSIQYYVFPVSPVLAEASGRLGLPGRFAIDLQYLISIAVKDFEVTRLLFERGYLDDQLAYAKHVLSTSEEDLKAWRISAGDPTRMALCLAGRLKDAACAIALSSKVLEVAEWMEDEFSYLPRGIYSDLSKLADKFSRGARGDTFENVDAITEIFVKELLEPLFSRS